MPSRESHSRVAAESRGSAQPLKAAPAPPVSRADAESRVSLATGAASLTRDRSREPQRTLPPRSLLPLRSAVASLSIGAFQHLPGPRDDLFQIERLLEDGAGV